MDPLLISLVSACTALVASVVGPFVTLAVAKRQFNATVLSANRQKWIETLRGFAGRVDFAARRRLGRQVGVERQMGQRAWPDHQGPGIAPEARTHCACPMEDPVARQSHQSGSSAT